MKETTAGEGVTPFGLLMTSNLAASVETIPRNLGLLPTLAFSNRHHQMKHGQLLLGLFHHSHHHQDAFAARKRYPDARF